MQKFRKIIISGLIACLFVYGLGYMHLEDAGDVARSLFFMCMTGALFFFSSAYRFFRTVMFIIGVIFSIYMMSGIGVDYGAPNMSLVASLLETNPSEAMEFLTNLSWRDLLLSGVLIFLLVIYNFSSGIKDAPSLDGRHRLIKISTFIFLLIFNIFVLFIYHSINAYGKYAKEKPLVGENLNIVDWEIKKIQRNKSLKVLVIGESVSKRYLSLMGSTWKTTPFLESSKNITAFTQYYSPAPNTVASLSRTLTYSQMKNGEFDLNRNVVSLAKAAEYQTIWISNQRSMGPNDSNVARMAHQADQYRFLDVPPVVEPAKDDFALLNYLRSKLINPREIPKESIVFLHMLGSHPHACSRVPDMPITLHAGHGRHIDCYLTSLQKLDNFIKDLTGLLAEYSDEYEIIYVSDHSLRVSPMSETEKWMDRLHLPTKNIYVQPQTREAYDTPLFYISSRQHESKKNATPLSGFDFFHLFGNWLGVTSPWINPAKNLEDPSSSAPIQVFNWNHMVPLDSLPDTLPIEPPLKMSEVHCRGSLKTCAD